MTAREDFGAVELAVRRALARYDLSERECVVVSWVLEWTLGAGKQWARISYEDLAEVSGMSIGNVCDMVKGNERLRRPGLERYGILVFNADGELGVVPDSSLWRAQPRAAAAAVEHATQGVTANGIRQPELRGLERGRDLRDGLMEACFEAVLPGRGAVAPSHQAQTCASGGQCGDLTAATRDRKWPDPETRAAALSGTLPESLDRPLSKGNVAPGADNSQIGNGSGAVAPGAIAMQFPKKEFPNRESIPEKGIPESGMGGKGGFVPSTVPVKRSTLNVSSKERLNVERYRLTRAREDDLWERLRTLVGEADLVSWGGDWRKNWLRADPERFEAALTEVESIKREGRIVPNTDWARYLKSIYRTFAPRV